MGWKVGLMVVLAALVCACNHERSGDDRAAAPAATGHAPMQRVLDGRQPVQAKRAAAPSVSNLPDSGQLVAYGAKADIRREGANTWYPVTLSEAHVLGAESGGPVRMTTPDGGSVTLRYRSHVPHADGIWTWIGRSDIPGMDDAIITFGQHSVFGVIPQRQGPPLRIAMRDARAWIVTTDPQRLGQLDNAATRPRKPDFLAPPRAASGQPAMQDILPAAEGATTSSATAYSTTDRKTVDLVLGYTSGFKAHWVSDSTCANIGAAHCESIRRDNTLSRLNFLVDVTNQAYVNSAVSAQVHVVRMVQVAYPDATSNESALEALTGYTESGPITPDAAFNALRAARNQYGADLVSLVRKFSDPENDGCGIAWLIGSGQSGISTADAAYGYSIVGDGADGGYYCRDETLAHELGHNMGSQHDAGNAESNAGVYAYSYGYKASWYYTVMAYGDSGQTSFRVFSNPRITYCSGYPCGTSQADNARSLNQTVPVIARFRNAVIAPPRANLPEFDADGNGKSDLFFTNGSSGNMAVWYMSGTSRLSYATYVTMLASLRLVDSGDMAGDGKGDLLYRDSTNHLVRYYSTGNGIEGRTVPDKIPPDWQPLAMVDINGDRATAEVVLRNPYTGSGAVWFYINDYLAKYNSFSVPAIYTFVGSGDLNGDRRSDVVWTDVSGRVLVSFSNGSALASAVQVPNIYDSTYSLIGVSDVNGDGRGDLVFWKASTRQLAVWFMQGATRTGYFSSIVPAGYWPVGRGDFNGDRRGDLAWTDGSRRIMLSLSSGSSYGYSVLPYVVSPGWITMGIN